MGCSSTNPLGDYKGSQKTACRGGFRLYTGAAVTATARIITQSPCAISSIFSWVLRAGAFEGAGRAVVRVRRRPFQNPSNQCDKAALIPSLDVFSVPHTPSPWPAARRPVCRRGRRGACDLALQARRTFLRPAITLPPFAQNLHRRAPAQRDSGRLICLIVRRWSFVSSAQAAPQEMPMPSIPASGPAPLGSPPVHPPSAPAPGVT